MARSKAEPEEQTEAEPTVRPNRRRGLWPALLLAVVVTVIVLAAQVLHLVPGWLNPFGEQTKDRSSPVVLKSIRDLSRYTAATGDYQVVVDLEKDAKFLPSAVRGQRTLFVGNGNVNAYVDFSKLASGAVTIDKNRTTATIKLPHARLEPTNLDPKKSYVFATQRGIFDRIGEFFSGNPNDQQQLYVLATQKIQDAAQQSGLLERADQNTKRMLENLLKALGFTTVTVTLIDAP
jgi:hypothetical protein